VMRNQRRGSSGAAVVIVVRFCWVLTLTLFRSPVTARLKALVATSADGMASSLEWWR
jgi:hypothetical protein